jgi:O-antigen/teichoic acid export membrane protein
MSDAVAVARGAGANLVGMLARLLRPLFLFAAASLYGPASFGEYMLAWAIVDVMGKAAPMGLDKALMRYVPRSESAARDRVLAACLRGTVLGGLGLTLLLAAASGGIARFYRMPDLRWVVLLLSPSVIATALVTSLCQALMAVDRMRGQILARGILEPAALIAFAVAGRFTLGRAPWVLGVAHAAAQLTTVAGALLIYSGTFSLRRSLLARGPRPEGLYHFALPMWASDGLAVGQQRVDLLVMARLLPEPALVGMYAVAKQIANVVNVVRFSFDPVFWPRVAALTERGDREGLAATYRLVARWVALLALPTAAVLGRFGPDLGRLVGRDYRGPLAVFVLLCIGQAFNSVFGLAGHLMAMAGRPRVVVWGYAIGIVLTVALTLALVPPLGIAGAAAASALSFAAVMSYQVLQAWRAYGVSPFSPELGKVALACVGMIAALLAAGQVAPAAVAITAALVLYFGAVWWWGAWQP